MTAARVNEPPPSLSFNFAGAFQQAGVEIENVAGERFAPGRAAEQQRISR